MTPAEQHARDVALVKAALKKPSSVCIVHPDCELKAIDAIIASVPSPVEPDSLKNATELATNIFANFLLRGGEGNPFTKMNMDWFVAGAASVIASVPVPSEPAAQEPPAEPDAELVRELDALTCEWCAIGHVPDADGKHRGEYSMFNIGIDCDGKGQAVVAHLRDRGRL